MGWTTKQFEFEGALVESGGLLFGLLEKEVEPLLDGHRHNKIKIAIERAPTSKTRPAKPIGGQQRVLSAVDSRPGNG